MRIEEIKLLPELDPRRSTKSGSLDLRAKKAEEYAEIGIESLPKIIIAQSVDANIDKAILSGWTRLEAAKIQQTEEVQVNIAAVGSFAEAYAIAVNSNATHGLSMTRTEKVEAARKLIGQCGITIKSAAKILSVPERTVLRWTKQVRTALGAAFATT